MNPDELSKHFSGYFEGDLPPDLERAVRHGLERSPEVAERYQRFAQAMDLIAAEPRHPLPRSFAREVMERIEQPAPRRRIPTALLQAAAVLIALGLLAAYQEWRFSATLAAKLEELTAGLDARLDLESETLRSRIAAGFDRLDGLASRIDAELLDGGRRDEVLGELRSELATLSRRLDHAPGTEVLDRIEQRVSAAIAGLEALDGRVEDVAALGRSLRETEVRILEWQRLTDHELRLLRTATSELASRTPGRGREPQALASVPPAVPTTEAVEMIVREDGRLSLRYQSGDPDAIARLFQLYEVGDSQLRALALDCLDAEFGDRVPVEEPRQQGLGLRDIFGSASPKEASREDRRVSSYRAYWLNAGGSRN